MIQKILNFLFPQNGLLNIGDTISDPEMGELTLADKYTNWGDLVYVFAAGSKTLKRDGDFIDFSIENKSITSITPRHQQLRR